MAKLIKMTAHRMPMHKQSQREREREREREKEL